MPLLLLLNQTESAEPGPADVTLTIAEPTGPLEVGDLVRRTLEFRRQGELVDPDTVTAHVRDPYGTTTTVTPTKAGLGTYRVDVTADMQGTWTYQVIGSTPYPGAIEKRFTVQPTAF